MSAHRQECAADWPDAPDLAILACVTPRERRRSQVFGIIRQSHAALDDEEIAQAARMNRVYVNMICRQLASDGLIARTPGPGGKLVNQSADGGQASAAVIPTDSQRRMRQPQGTAGRLAERVQELISDFAGYITTFEANESFPGPSLYFHLRAIERRRQHQTVKSLLDDTQFLEYAYAVLPAWGMHRMGAQAAKVGDFSQITAALREAAPALEQLWPLRITILSQQEADKAAATAWEVIAHIKVSTSRTQIVAGSKMLHHLLPDLIPPIDRRYTFRFFTGQMTVVSDRAAFLSWLPQLANIGSQCQQPILDAIRRGGFMATGEAKIIDNAIMGYMQQRRYGGDQPGSTLPV